MLKDQMATEGSKVALPVAVTASSLLGMSWQDATYIATFCYIVLQGAYLVYKWYNEHKNKNGGGDGKSN